MKRYEVFVSSPQKFFIKERKAVIDSILQLDHIPRAMEYFPSSSKNSWEYIQSVIDKCDYYILILAASYGSKEKKSHMGFTEKEFRYALKKKIPTITFLHRDPGSLPYEQHDDTPSLLKFYKFVEARPLCKYWDSDNTLASLVPASLINLIANFKRPGWIRADEQIISSTSHPGADYFSKNVFILLNSPYRENVTADVRYDYAKDDGYLEVEDIVTYRCRAFNGSINKKISWSIQRDEFNQFRFITIDIQKPNGETKKLFSKNDFGTDNSNDDFVFVYEIDDNWNVDELLVIITAHYLVLLNHFLSWEMPELTHQFALTIRFPSNLDIFHISYLLTYERGVYQKSEGHFSYKFYDWVLPREGLTWQLKKSL